MTTIRGRRRAAALLVSALAGSLLALAPGTAGAAENAPPVPQDDVVRVVAGSSTLVDLLANDSDPDGDRLEVCRMGRVPRALDISTISGFDGPDGELEDQYVVQAARGAAGRTFTIGYHVCDLERLVPATLTVRVVRPPQIKVSKLANRPGVLRVRNPSRISMQFVWGAPGRLRLDGRERLAAGTTITVPVRRRTVFWAAGSNRLGLIDEGVVRDIRLRPAAAAGTAADSWPAWSEATRG